MKWRKLVWLILWIVSIIGISFYGGAVSYGFFFMLTLLPLISFVYLLCVFLRFKIYQEVEARDMVCGQAMPYYFMLKNEDYFGFAGVNVRLFPDFSFVERLPGDIEYELLPGDEFVYRTRITCKYRGEYEIGIKEVVVTDFFRIFRLRYRMVGTIKAIVKPKVVEVEKLAALPQIADVLPKETFFALSEPDVIVRDYVDGDSLKRIHWKATAAAGQLKVRREIGEEKRGITLFLDTCRHDRKIEKHLPLESKMLEVLLALGIFFAKRNMSVSAYCKQAETRRLDVGSVRGFEDFYGQVSELSFREEERVEELLEELHISGAVRDSKVVIGIVHKVNQELLKLADELAAGGCVVVLYAVTNENLEAYVRENTARRRLVVIPTEAELEGLL